MACGVAQGILYIGVDDGYLYALYEGSGGTVWSIQGNGSMSSPTVGQ